MAVSVQDILNLIEDYTATNSGQLNTSAKIRGINTAISFLQRKCGLPNNEKINSFYWSDDQFFYSVPADFMEELDIMWNNPDYNYPEREWEFDEYSTLLKRSGVSPSGNKWSITTINGSTQIVMLGSNINNGTVIETFDTIGDWIASGDASALTVDALQKKVGDASLSFDIVASTGLATLTDASESLSVKSLFENHGYFKLWTFMTSTAIDSVILRLFVDASNYWTITETDLDDGSAYVANAWKKIGWPLDNAVKTGTPTIDQTVTKIQIIFDLGAGLVSAVDFRVDQLFTTIPDYMDFVYRSRYKGANASGTALTTLTAVTDTIGICDLFPDADDIIARRASMNLWPALRADKEWYAIYTSEMKEFLRDFAMRFPRRRNSKYLNTKLRR